MIEIQRSVIVVISTLSSYCACEQVTCTFIIEVKFVNFELCCNGLFIYENNHLQTYVILSFETRITTTLQYNIAKKE